VSVPNAIGTKPVCKFDQPFEVGEITYAPVACRANAVELYRQKPAAVEVARIDRRGPAQAEREGEGQPLPTGAGERDARLELLGRPPELAFGANLPFTKQVQLNGMGVEVRMESWLSADTIRRMGFGQVVAGRHHALIVERGISFAALDRTGRAIRTAYAANIFSAQPRYLIRTGR